MRSHCLLGSVSSRAALYFSIQVCCLSSTANSPRPHGGRQPSSNAAQTFCGNLSNVIQKRLWYTVYLLIPTLSKYSKFCRSRHRSRVRARCSFHQPAKGGCGVRSPDVPATWEERHQSRLRKEWTEERLERCCSVPHTGPTR